MLISCPYCGPRDVAEFTYQGDGNRSRPNPMSQDIEAWNDYVFDRVNIAGDLDEIWQHSGGCRSHLAISRNTVTHKVSSVRMVRDSQPTIAIRKELATTQIALEEQALATAKAGVGTIAKSPRKSATKPSTSAVRKRSAK